MKTLIKPFILGQGRAGSAIVNSLNIFNNLDKNFEVSSANFIQRGTKLKSLMVGKGSAIFIANPPGLHAPAIKDAIEAGFEFVFCEKPSCVNLEEFKELKTISKKVAILHVYRQTWGIQTIKKLFEAGELGELISIEGRYWQSSAAYRALMGDTTPSWKDDPKLLGEYDTLLDVGTHWLDAAIYLAGIKPLKACKWLSYANSKKVHRDTHVHLVVQFEDDKRAFASISKTFHGATNHFEVNLIGSKKSATWNFLNPDEILLGEGKDRKVLTRKESQFGSLQMPFHATGWLEGYIEIIRQVLTETNSSTTNYPTLQESLVTIETLLTASHL